MFSWYWSFLSVRGLVFEEHIGLDTGQGCAQHPETAMTELSNDPAALTTTTSTASPFTLFSGPETLKMPATLAPVGQSETIDLEQLSSWVALQQEPGDSPANEALTPAEVASLSMRRLRMLVNQAYALMDTDYPSARAVERYEMLVDELELRAEAAENRNATKTSREKFRDSPLHCRFELFMDGNLAAYMQYRMSGGDLTLIMGTELPGFRDQGADQTLMRNIVLNAHKRRLKLTPSCPMAYAFLTDHPQYQQFTGHH